MVLLFCLATGGVEKTGLVVVAVQGPPLFRDNLASKVRDQSRVSKETIPIP